MGGSATAASSALKEGAKAAVGAATKATLSATAKHGLWVLTKPTELAPSH